MPCHALVGFCLIVGLIGGPFAFGLAQNNRSKKKGEFHGKGGLMQVENARYMNPLTKMFFKACQQAGLSENDDFNDWSHSQEGFGRFQVR